MSYTGERDKVGREPYTRLEVDMPTCALTYGVAPCTAAGGAGNQCKNTNNTCQDAANYDGSGVNTIALCDRHIQIVGVPMRPYIESKNLSPTVIDRKKALGRRASISVTCVDEPSHDRDIDPYWASRDYTAEDQGTFWGKVKAIYKYYPGAAMRLITGYISEDGYSVADTITRHYVLDEINGPKNGKVTLTGKDVLKLADDKRALCPVPTTGILAAAITSGSTASFTLTDGAGQYDVGSGRIRIGEEVIAYTAGSDSSDDFVVAGTITRDVDGTGAEEHDEGDTAQKCYHLDDNVVDVVYDLLTNFGNIDAGTIITADWDEQRDTWLNNVPIDYWLTKAEGVTSLINEMSEQFLFQIWADEVNQKIRFRATSPWDDVTTTWTDGGNILPNNVKVDELVDDRLSRVLVHYKPRNSIEWDKPEHFAASYVKADADSEGADQHGDIRVKEIFARFINSQTLALRCGSRTLAIFLETPFDLEIEIDAKDSGVVTGDAVNIASLAKQDVDGSKKTTLMQVISAQEIVTGSKYRYRLTSTAYRDTRYGRIMTPGQPDYVDASNALKNSGAYICGPGGAKFADGGDPYLIN